MNRSSTTSGRVYSSIVLHYQSPPHVDTFNSSQPVRRFCGIVCEGSLLQCASHSALQKILINVPAPRCSINGVTRLFKTLEADANWNWRCSTPCPTTRTHHLPPATAKSHVPSAQPPPPFVRSSGADERLANPFALITSHLPAASPPHR
jgi:hypothetical protein